MPHGRATPPSKACVAIVVLLLAGCADYMVAVTPDAYEKAKTVCAAHQGLGWVKTDSYSAGGGYFVKAVCRDGLRAEFKSDQRAVP